MRLSLKIYRLIVALTIPLIGCRGGPPQESAVGIRGDTTFVDRSLLSIPMLVPESLPIVDIGEPAELFGSILQGRIGNDGTIIVYDVDGPRRKGVIQFDQTGRFRKLLAGLGDGPAEVRGFIDIGTDHTDTVRVYASNHRRMTLFGREGQLIRAQALDLDAISIEVIPVGWLADGTWIAQAVLALMGHPVGEYRDTIRIVSIEGRGRIDTIASVESAHYFVLPGEHGGIGAAGAARFSAPPCVDARDSTIVIASPDTGIIQILGQGRRRTIVRLVDPPARVTAALVEQLDRKVMAGVRDPGSAYHEMVRQGLRKQPRRQSFPFFFDCFIDRRGLVWIGEYQVEERGTADQVWWLLDLSGVVVMRVRLPSARTFAPLDASDHGVLGVWKGKDGVERLRLFRLRKSDPGEF